MSDSRTDEDEIEKPQRKCSIHSHRMPVEELCKIVSNTRLVRVDIFGDFNAPPESALRLLAQTTSVTWLLLLDTCIGDEGAKLIAMSSSLRHLNLTGNRIRSAGAAALARNTVLWRLNLVINQVGTRGAAALARSPTLRCLYLESNGLSIKDARDFASNTSLTDLDCCCAKGIERVKIVLAFRGAVSGAPLLDHL